MKNIILIGMPGAGKSTIGVLLAKAILYSFSDTDLLIQSREGMSLNEIIEKFGNEKFLEIENKVICDFEFYHTVVATGGSVVYGKAAMEKLKTQGLIIYLELPVKVLKKRLSNIHTRGIAMEKSESIEELYNKRKPLYEKYADITLECAGLTAEQCVEKIVEIINTDSK